MRDYKTEKPDHFRPRNDVSFGSLSSADGNEEKMLFSRTGSFSKEALDATDGWLELFLTPSQKRTFSKWKENVKDKSLTNRVTKNAFDQIATFWLE